jgi:hypothetical protein
MRLSPTGDTVASGQTFTVTIGVTIGSEPANAVQASLSFPDAQLDCTSAAVNTGTWGITAEKTCTGNKVTIAVGSITPRTGTVTLATVTFTGVDPGTADVTFASDSQVLGAQTNTDSLGSTTGGTYGVTG